MKVYFHIHMPKEVWLFKLMPIIKNLKQIINFYIIPCNLYGEFDKFGDIEGHFVGALIEKIIEAKKNDKNYISLFGDGTPKRQFMHAKDLAKIIKLSIDNKITENFNVATNENYSVAKIAQLALKACNFKDAKIFFDKRMPNGQMRKDIDISKLKKLFQNLKLLN